MYLYAITGALVATLMVGYAFARNDVVSDLAPRFLAEVRRPPATGAEARRPALALVLGGGGLRGFAHIGIVRALEEAGIKPDIVVGTSAGAVVGAAYASGMTHAQIAAAASSVKLPSLFDLTLSSGGIMRGNNIAQWIDTITAGVPIERFPLRFGAVATDLQTAQAVLLDRGAAGRAVQASTAVPGVTVPVSYQNGHLIDGGVTSLVPVRFARAMGADLVIAVDVYCEGARSNARHAPAVISQVMHIQSCLIAKAEMAEADVLIAPAVSISGMSAKDEQAAAIQAGYEAARAALPGILAQAGAPHLSAQPAVRRAPAALGG